jgi:hypothetical protein
LKYLLSIVLSLWCCVAFAQFGSYKNLEQAKDSIAFNRALLDLRVTWDKLSDDELAQVETEVTSRLQAIAGRVNSQRALLFFAKYLSSRKHFSQASTIVRELLQQTNGRLHAEISFFAAQLYKPISPVVAMRHFDDALTFYEAAKDHWKLAIVHDAYSVLLFMMRIRFCSMPMKISMAR